MVNTTVDTVVVVAEKSVVARNGREREFVECATPYEIIMDL